MKAIEINGEIKTFEKLPKSWTNDNGTYLNLKDGYDLGFKDVVVPEYDERINQIGDIYLDGDVFTYEIIEKPILGTLSELKEDTIAYLKYLVSSKLSATDWYIIRQSDSGEPVPDSVKAERAELRARSNAMESEINALTTKKEVVLFDLNI